MLSSKQDKKEDKLWYVKLRGCDKRVKFETCDIVYALDIDVMTIYEIKLDGSGKERFDRFNLK